MIQLLLILKVTQYLLCEAVVHPEHVIDDLDGCDREAQNCLREQLVLVEGRMLRGGLEELVAREQDSSDHVHDTEELRVLDHEEDVLCDLVCLLVDRPVDGIHGDKRG